MDGSAFLLLTVPMAQSYLGAKLGPAMKLCAHVEQLKQIYASLFAPGLPYADEPLASLSELLPPVEPSSLPPTQSDLSPLTDVVDHPMAEEPPTFVPPAPPVESGDTDVPIAEATADAAPGAPTEKPTEEPAPAVVAEAPADEAASEEMMTRPPDVQEPPTVGTDECDGVMESTAAAAAPVQSAGGESSLVASDQHEMDHAAAPSGDVTSDTRVVVSNDAHSEPQQPAE